MAKKERNIFSPSLIDTVVKRYYRIIVDKVTVGHHFVVGGVMTGEDEDFSKQIQHLKMK